MFYIFLKVSCIQYTQTMSMGRLGSKNAYRYIKGNRGSINPKHENKVKHRQEVS